MTSFLKFHVFFALFTVVSALPVAYGQAAPAATTSLSPAVGPGLPSLDGSFHYALSASELLQTGYNRSGVGFTTSLSGDAAYNNKSAELPFGMIYAGGLLMGNQYQQAVRTFQNLALSQGLVTGKWILGITDSVSYLPQSPTLGLSGIPGVGDLGTLPIQGPGSGPAGGVLTNNSTSVSNSLSGSVERRLTGRTSISGTGSWMILRFPDENTGLGNTQIVGEAGLNHQMDARDTVSGNVNYSVYSYGGGIGLTVLSKGISGAYQRVLSRSLSMSVSAGPEWISGSDSKLIPSRVTTSANLSLSYARETTDASLHYSRGVNGGSGVQPGALSDNISAIIGRSYGRDWMGSVTANYTHSSGLLQNGVTVGPEENFASFAYTGGIINLVFGGAQVSRRLGRSLSAYLSYNLQHQSVTNSLAFQNAYSGLTQTVGIGITFSPRSTRLGTF
jgi:hypothetical protein